MSNKFTVYDSSGKILRTGSTPFDIGLQKGESESVINGESDPEKQLVDVSSSPHTIMDRSVCPITVNKNTIEADGIDECVISNIPNNTMVIWPDGLISSITDGEIRFSIDLEGSYTFRIRPTLHLKEEINIEAVTTI